METSSVKEELKSLESKIAYVLHNLVDLVNKNKDKEDEAWLLHQHIHDLFEKPIN